MAPRGPGAKTRQERERLFGWVYENNQWGRSPAGARYYSDSPPQHTEPYRAIVSDFIRANGIRRVVDLGCGDFVASSGIDMGDAHCIGVDIYDRLIADDRARFGDDRHEFVVADLIEDDLPSGDLALISTVLYLMSHADALAVLHKLQRYRYVIATDGQPKTPVAERRNIDKPTDKYTPRDWHGTGFWLELAPFNLDVTVLCEHELPDGECMRTVLLQHPMPGGGDPA
jgi:SAM-dependent methyltransferase